VTDPSKTIAVVVPLYNKAPHIDRAMNSILGQTLPPDEIIIVDDASTDDGLAKVAAVQDPRIRIIERDAPGPGGYAARNAGIEAAASEWIAFLDADDSWTPEACAEVRRLIDLADDGVSCLFTAYNRDYGDRVVSASGFAEFCPDGVQRLDFAGFIDAWLKIGQSPMWTSAVVARRSSLIAAGLFPAGKCNRGGDKDMWLRLLTVGDALCSSVETATYHRDSVNMVTKVTNTNQRPYLCGTLAGLTSSYDAAVGKRIKRLINWEIYSHAREAWRAGHRLDPDLYQGFNIRQAPVTYALLTTMAHAPGWMLDASHGAKSLVRRIKPKKRRAA